MSLGFPTGGAPVGVWFTLTGSDGADERHRRRGARLDKGASQATLTLRERPERSEALQAASTEEGFRGAGSRANRRQSPPGTRSAGTPPRSPGPADTRASDSARAP